MGNKAKLTASYFPHYAAQKKTVPILKSKFGSDGYAFWYQLLEMLCSANGHFLDCSTPGDVDFMAAQMGIPVESIELILRELVFRGKIDKELWEFDRVIWCQGLVDNLISTLYSKRETKPRRPFPSRKRPFPVNQSDSRHGKAINSPVKTGIEENRIEENRREENRREEKEDNGTGNPFDMFWQAYPKKRAKADALKSWLKINPDEEMIKNILNSIESQKQTKDWIKDGGKFIPYPETWLNGKRWEDESDQSHPTLTPVQLAVLEARKKRIEKEQEQQPEEESDVYFDPMYLPEPGEYDDGEYNND